MLGFCALASAVYLFNDLCNLKEDRAHPVKRLRPLAFGSVRRRTAVSMAVSLAVAGIGVLLLTTPMTLFMGLAYVCLHVVYSLGVRNVPVLELFFLATGFALRVLAGAFAASISWSAPLLLTTYGLSLLLGLGKRKAETHWGTEVNQSTRPVLRHYTPGKLAALLYGTAAVTVVSYVWLAQRHLFGVSIALSSILVALGVARYLWIILKLQGGESPERLLYSDLVMTAVLIGWAGVFLHGVYG